MAQEREDGKVQALHPTLLDDEEMSPYLDELSFAFSDPQVTNIAISGPYGAGKSTVVDTWEHRELEKAKGAKGKSQPWVRISLAEFAGEDRSEVPTEGEEGQDAKQGAYRDIESELINQLIFKLRPGNAPKSRFGITEDSARLKDVGKALFVAIAVGLSVALILGWGNDSLPWMHGISAAIMSSAWLACVFIVAYRGVKTHSVTRILKRLKLFNAEVEIFGDKDDPAFDRYMDDIVYLLVASKNKVVVFEDLDRFSDVAVFEKLRRVNELANARRTKPTRRRLRNLLMRFRKDESDKTAPLRFVYLVRDSLFKDPKDRTKFFDLIIPVVPFVDPSNSFDILRSGLNKVGIQPSEEFLYQLSLYVDDPRILKDICNESYHYSKSLVVIGKEPKNWDYDKLVAMVAYKVLFPEDYERLQVREGYVFALFQQQQQLAERKHAKLAENVKKLEEEIKEIEFRTQVNEEELKLLYSLTDRSMRYSICNNISSGFNDRFASVDELIEAIKNDSNVRDAETNAIAALGEEGTEYSLRLEAISGKGNRTVDAIRTEIASINQQALRTDRESLADLLGSIDNLDDFFSPKQENDTEKGSTQQVVQSKYFPMIRFLIIQGYIDEDYSLYMSNQYDEASSPGDREFLNSVLGGYPTSPDQNIEQPSSVIIRLKGSQLARPSARNYSLLHELLEHGPSEKLSKFIAGIAHDRDYAFVVSYVLSDKLSEKVYPILAEGYADCVVEAMRDIAIKDDIKRSFCKRMMSSEKSLSLVERSAEAIGEFAMEDPLFISAADVTNAMAFKASLEKIGYVADRIDFENADRQLLSFVASKGMLQPRAGMILGCVELLVSGKPIGFSNLNNVLVDAGADEILESLRGYAFANLDKYLPSLIEEAKGNLADNDKAIQTVLNELPETAEEFADEYVAKLTNSVQQLKMINERAYWTLLVKNSKCANTTENLCQYIGNLGFDDELARYIELSGVPTDFSSTSVGEFGGEPMVLLKGLLEHEEIALDTLTSFANALDESFAQFRCPNCASERIAATIRSGLLSVTAENLSSMRADYPDLVPLFASQDLASYLELVAPEDAAMPKCTFVDNEALELFEMNGLDPRLLLKLVDSLSAPIPLAQKYPDVVNMELIATGKFNGDNSNFSAVYESAGKKLRAALSKVLVNSPRSAESTVLPYDLADNVIRQLVGNRDEAKRFLADRVRNDRSSMGRKGVANLAAAGGLDDYARLIRTEKKSVSIEVGSADMALIQALEEKGLCGRLSDTTSEDGKRVLHAKGYSKKH